MNVTKQITIYDSRSADTDQKHNPTDVINHIDNFATDEIRVHNQLRIKNTPIAASMPSILIKNIIYNVMPIIDKNDKYKMYVQLPAPIKVFNIGNGVYIKNKNDIIPMSGIYFDSDATFFQTSIKYTNLHPNDRFIMGGNAMRDLEYTLDFLTSMNTILNFTQQRTEYALTRVHFAIKFTSDADSLKKIKMIYAFMMSRRRIFMRMYEKVAKTIFVIPTPKNIIDTPHSTVIMPAVGTNIAIAAMEKILNMKLSHLDENQFISIIMSFNMLFSYISILHAGRPTALKLTDYYKTKMMLAITSNIQRTKNIKDDAKAAWLNNISIREFQTQYVNLAQDKKDIIDNQYKHDLNVVTAMRENKCPHLQLLKKVMRSRASVFDSAAWTDLKKYVPLKPPPLINGTVKLPNYKSMLKCNMCHFDALCPHYYVIFDMGDVMFNGDKNAMNDYVIRTFSKDIRSDDDSYYCSICGGLIMRNMIEGEIWAMKNTGSAGAYDDSLSNIIQSEVWRTLSINLDVGHVNIDKMSLSNNIIEIINPHIRTYEIKLSRVKTNTENVVLFSLYIIITVYVFAIIIHMSSISKGDITIRGTNVKGLKHMDLLHRLFNSAYKLILKQHMSTIDKIPSFTPDHIKKILTRAYQHVSGTQIDIETIEAERFIDLISNNNVYNFIYIGHVISNFTNGKSRPMYADTKKILGVSFDKVKDLRMLFDKAKMPAIWKNIDQYYWDSYSFFAERILTNTFIRNDIHKKIIDDKVCALQKRWKKMLDYNAANKNIGSNIKIKWSSNVRKYDKDRLLSVIYCKNGKQHVWNIYVYENGPRVVEVRTGQFGKIDIAGMDLITLKCSVCGDAYGKTNHDDIDKILLDNIQRAAFFQFYSYKCPIEYKHNFVNDECTQCGFTKQKLNAADSEYYEKYKNDYVKEKNKETMHLKKDIFNINEYARRERMIVLTKMKPVTKLKPWGFSNDNIIKLSKTMMVPYNVLLNIGLMSDYDFDTIKSNKFNPSANVSDEMFILQANAVSGYIIDFAAKYNRFTKCSAVAMNEELDELCKTKFTDIMSLSQIDLTTYFSERQERKHEKARHYANWELSWLCNMILHIYNSQSNSNINIKFATIFMDELMDAELNNSKPKLYKRALSIAKESSNSADVTVNMVNIDITDSYAKDQINIDDNNAINLNDIDVEDMAESMGDDVI